MGGYFKKTIEYIKEKINSQGKKKLIENSVIIIIIGVIILIAGNTLFGNNNSKKINQKEIAIESSSGPNKNSAEKAEVNLETKLEAILSKIDGVGKASVMITYVSGKELIPAYDMKNNETDTVEKDNQGGSRNTRQKNNEESIVFEEEQGIKKPIIIKDIEPVVKGVIVVADGANDPVVRESVMKAVQVLMDIPIHKIQVFERSKR